MSRLSKYLSYVAGFVLIAMMLLTTADVAGRYLFNSPILGVFEVTEFTMVCLVFCSLAYTQSKKAHVAVDILASLMPPKGQRFIDIINYLISFLILALITWKSIERGFEVMANKESSAILQIPVYPFMFLVALGSAALCIEYLKDIINACRPNSSALAKRG
jgi:TRAP-type C4-dicarboxylate transport system permease small subunit